MLGNQILGLRPAIAQAMVQHLPTPAGQPQSAEVLVAVLALVGDAITISTTFDFAAPAGSISAANNICRAHHAIFANSSIRYRQPFYWRRTLQTPWCEYSSRPCGSCNRARAWLVHPNHRLHPCHDQPSSSLTSCMHLYTGLPHLLTPTIPALLVYASLCTSRALTQACVKMHA